MTSLTTIGGEDEQGRRALLRFAGDDPETINYSWGNGSAMRVSPVAYACRTIEEVLRRENLLRALKRVRRNKGAPGVDGMTVEELPEFLRTGSCKQVPYQFRKSDGELIDEMVRD